MLKTLTTGLCALALTTTFAFAQSSQGQAGADTGPTSPTAPMTNSSMNKGSMTRSPMNSNAKMMMKKKMHMHHMKHMMKKDGM